jgi:hypothetical protein
MIRLEIAKRNCQIFRLDSENEGLDIVEESATSETEKEIAREVTARTI